MPATVPMFNGSMPAFYDRYLGPVAFVPYAVEMAKRVRGVNPARVLETACGTGIVTYSIADAFPEGLEIVATDLSQPMLDFASAKRPASSVIWHQADALDLPFADASFDAVVCQFGVMFFPDKLKGMREARRVLKPTGYFLFSVWDSLQENELPRTSALAIAAMFPDDPPTFIQRVPYGYNDPVAIKAQLHDAGFKVVEVDKVAKKLEVSSARDYACGAAQGGPLRNEIEKRDADGLERATELATRAIEKRFGQGSFTADSQALFFSAR